MRRSGLSDETLRIAGISSETDPKEIMLGLNWRGHRKNVAPAIKFPYTDHTGNLNGFARFKLDTPRIRKKDGVDKPTKYEAPKGVPNRVYIPPQVVEHLQDTSRALLITEGEKKCLKAVQEGFTCVALAGVFSWKPKGKEWLIQDFERIPFAGRKVYIVFDSDRLTNPLVEAAEARLARLLQKLGATVVIVELPAGEESEDGTPSKVGLDDYLVSHSAGELGALLDAAESPDDEEPAIEKVDARNLDPMRMARKFADECLTHTVDGQKLYNVRYWRGEWWWWNPSKTRYCRVVDDMVKAQLRLFLENFALFVTNPVVANIVGSLAAVVFVGDSVEFPAWLTGPVEFKATEILATKSALLHLPSLVDGVLKSLPATPQFFSSISLDFDYDPKAPPPVAWLDFLGQLFGDDHASIECLQEWFGYLLSPETGLQKILGIVGPRRSGKGTIARVLRGLIGADNVTAPTLAGLGTNFGLWPIYDKSVAIISDARLSGRTDSAVVTERLLSISGEDAQTFDRKNLKPLTMKLPTRFVVLTNELPRLGDSSNALVGRFIILKLSKSFYGMEDPCLTQKLLIELPGILVWSIEGLKRLRARGHFLQPGSGTGLIGEMEALASPVGEFVRECCIVEARQEVLRDELYAAWGEWCKRNGRRESDSGVFGRDLRAAVSSIGDKQKNEFGVRSRWYVGIGLKMPNDPTGAF
jgi:putative DNA primase/helicase